MSETQPTDPAGTQPSELSGTQPAQASAPQPRKLRFPAPIFWISLLALIASVFLGGAAGYGFGISERLSVKETVVAKTLGDQFALAQQDFAAKNYDVVRQRLEYILKEDPTYPGAADLLTQVIVQMGITPTVTLTPTPSMTPTPDLRSQNAIFAQIQQSLQNKDWTSALGSLDALRKADPTYKTAQVDSMYYTALRNRGVDQILGNGPYAQTTNLEGGIYDLTLAERFGPLDGTADGLRNFARLYITGASFWDLDWAQARDYFAQVYQFTPNLRDSSNMTAAQRYDQALLNYGDQIAASAKLKDRCPALNAWQQANGIAPLSADYANKFAALNLLCNPPTKTPTPTSIAAPTETPTP